MSWSEWAPGRAVEPSIYAADFARLGEQVSALLQAGARVFHVDVGDGHFIPPVTFGPVVIQAIAPLVHEAGGVLDCHLMVDNPASQIPELAAAGADSVTFHVEVVEAPDEVVALARGLGLGVGVALNPGTPVELAAGAAAGADLVLCMSIVPGYSGQPFMPEALPRIRRLRSILPPSVRLQVDGGIGGRTIADAHEAGASLLVAGSAVFGADDPGEAYRALAAAVGA
ncbi:MAG: ribulose-phosphate 3-epimerase [Thermoleophilia bacterium]